MGTKIGQIDLGLSVNTALFKKQINGLAKSTRSTVFDAFKPVGRLIGGALALGSIAKFTKSCLDLGSDLTEVQNVVDTTFKTLNGEVNKFADSAMERFGMSETVAKQYMGTLGAMSKSMGFAEQASYHMAEAITGLTGDVASFYNLSTDEAFDKLKSIWTGETETLKSIGVLLTQTNLDQYALNNGFGKTTASMTEQEKVMLRYRYVMSSLADASGDFAKTSGSWANQTRILSLQFDALKATLGQGFINLFTPIIQMINSLMAKLQVLARQFKAFTEMLTGNRSESTDMASMATDAENAAAGVGSIADQAKKAAKATRLLGIDEINKIGSSGVADSGGIGSAATNIPILNTAISSTGGIVGDVNGEVDVLIQKFEKFGALIEPFTGALKRLWEGGLSKLGEFSATGLKDFYESFLVPIATWAFGTEDKGLSRLVDIINEDLCGVDWNTINKNLKEFWIAIEPYAENFGEGLIDFFEDAADLGIDILEKLFGEDGLLVDFTEWLNDNDPEVARDWGYALGVLAAGLTLFKILKPAIAVLSFIMKLFGKFPGLDFGGLSGLMEALGSLGGLKGLLTTDLATIFGAGTASEIGLTIGTGLIGGIAAAIGGFNFGKWLGKQLFPEDADWYDNFKFFGEGGFFDTISSDWGTSFEALDQMWTDIQNNKVVQFLTGNIAGLFGGERKTWKETKEEAVSAFTGIKDELTREWNTAMENIDTLSDWYENSVKPYFDSGKWKGLWGAIKNVAAEKWTEFKEWWNGSALVSWWNDDVSPWFTKEKWTGLYNSIKESLGDKWDEIKEWWNSSALVVWWKEDVSPWFTKEKWSGIFNNIKTSITDIWNTVKQWWDNNALTKWWRESVAPWFTKEKWFGGMAGIKDGFKEAFKNACNAGIQIFNRFIGWLNDKMHISWGAFSVLGSEIIPAGSIQLLNIPSIPMLAEGGYVGPNQPRLAMIGDNRHYGEIVAPEDKMLQVMTVALEQFFSKLQSTGQQAPVSDNGDIIIPIYIGQDKIDEIIITAQQRKNMRSGGR